MNIKRLTDVNLSGKRVMMRVDFNVPIKEGKVSSDQRIVAALPGIRTILASGAQLILLSHLGRPTEGEYNAAYSLQPVANHLAELLGHAVPLIQNWVEDGINVSEQSGHARIVLCENVRFNKGEKGNCPELAQKMAEHCDLFVMDAFGTAHRAQASTYGIAEFAKEAVAGPLLVAELEALARSFANPKPPLVAIVGGSKVSTKLTVLETLINQVDQLIVGGGIANTFLAAAGYQIGQSLYEPELMDQAKSMLASGKIPLPSDVVVATTLSEQASGTVKPITGVHDNEMILDIGPETTASWCRILADAGTIVWNGPVGVFEMTPFSAGTRGIAEAVASSQAFSIAGGGDTLAAIEQFNIAHQVSYISTGGGAFLEFLEGKVLPSVEILQRKASLSEA